MIDDWEDPKLEIYHTQDRYIAPTHPSLPFPCFIRIIVYILSFIPNFHDSIVVEKRLGKNIAS